MKTRKRNLSPSLVIVFSFVAAIILATVTFMLPFSTTAGNEFSFLEALLLGTSAITITGFSPVAELGVSLSLFGKIMLTIFMQIGGLGIVTIGIFLMLLLRAKIGISNRVLLRDNLNALSVGGVVSLAKKIAYITLIVEAFGFILNLFVFVPLFPTLDAVGYSLFYSLSAFNNAGFNILSIADHSLVFSHPLFIINSTLLVVLGGLGFLVLIELLERRKRRFSIHTKIVLYMNGLLWIFGVLMLKLGQNGAVFMSWGDAIKLSLTARSSGLFVSDASFLSSFSLLILMFLMFVGGAPTGTASGIKVTTLFTLGNSLFSDSIRGGKTFFKRRISDISKQKAFIVTGLLIFSLMLGTMLLTLFENINLEIASFSALSALSNTGFSIVDISVFKASSKSVLIILMFFGRIGPFTILTLFSNNMHKIGQPAIGYLEEKVIIG